MIFLYFFISLTLELRGGEPITENNIQMIKMIGVSRLRNPPDPLSLVQIRVILVAVAVMLETMVVMMMMTMVVVMLVTISRESSMHGIMMIPPFHHHSTS